MMGTSKKLQSPFVDRYWGMQPDGDFGIEIVFDEDDIEDCKEVAFVLYGVIHGHYGAAVANKIFSERVMTAQQIKKEKNDRLLMTALRRLINARSVEQVAADLAEENKTQWRVGGTWFRGLAGAGNPSTMATQIRRLWKKNKNNPDIRQWLSTYAGAGMGGRGPKDGQAKGASDLRQKEVASLRQTLGHFEMKMSENVQTF